MDYDLTNADVERAGEIAEEFVDLSHELLIDGEEIDDLVCGMVLCINWLMALRDAETAVIN